MKSILSICLSFIMAATSPGFVWASQNVRHKNRVSLSAKNYLDALFNQSPILEDLINADAFGKEMEPQYDPNDPLIDKDPFFMRSQQWVNKSKISTGDSYQVKSEAHSVSIGHENWSKALKINHALNVTLITDEYLFLSLNKNENLFINKSPDESGEGVFFVSRDDLATAYQQSFLADKDSAISRVPVYFLPLPELGWTGPLLAFEWQEMDHVVFYNQIDKTPLPIANEDIRHLEKVLKLNLALAKAQTLLTLKEHNVHPLAKMFPFPSRGATAGFGIALTGISLDSALATLVKADLPKMLKWMAPITKYVFLQKAHADVSQFISPDFLLRFQILASMLTTGFVASIALKHFKYREHFKEKYKDDSSGSTNTVKRALKKIKSETKSLFDVYSHVLTVFSTFFNINIIDSLDYLGDKFASEKMGPKNGILRRAFNNTLGWSRSAALNLAVNNKTFFLGAIILGSVDTSLVVLQLLYVTPWLLDHMSTGANSSNEISEQEENINDNTGATARFVSGEIIRNVIGYLSHGALGYAHEQRVLVQDRVTHEVDTELKRQGLDPHDKKNQAKREKLVAEKMNVAMKLRGLPDKDEFLFDMGTINKHLSSKNGFSVSDLNVGEDTAGHFLFESGRRGLTKVVLEKSIQQAQRIQNLTGTKVGENATHILTTMQQRLGLKSKILLKDKKMARDVNKTLTLFSYGGDDIESWVEYVPESIKSIANDKQALIAVAQIYNTSLYDLMDGREHSLKPTYSEEYKYRTEAEVIKAQNISDAFAKEVAVSRAIDIAAKKDSVFQELINFKPTKKSFLEKRQEKKAHIKARIRMAEQSLDANDEKLYQQVFAEELARVVNLHVKGNSKFVKQVNEDAELNTLSQLDREQYYVNSLNEKEQKEYKSWVYAKNVLNSYRKMSVESDEYLDAFSPEMPGKYQKKRQKIASTTESKLLTGLLRSFEAFTSTSSNDTGVMSLLDRNIPFFHDIRHNILRDARRIPYLVSFGYLVSYYIMQVRIDYPIWLLFIGMGFLSFATVELLNRGMQNFGIKPMDGVWSKVKYGFLHSWLTYPIFIPIMAWADPASKWWDAYINSPLKELGKTCVDILTGK